MKQSWTSELGDFTMRAKVRKLPLYSYAFDSLTYREQIYLIAYIVSLGLMIHQKLRSQVTVLDSVIFLSRLNWLGFMTLLCVWSCSGRRSAWGDWRGSAERWDRDLSSLCLALSPNLCGCFLVSWTDYVLCFFTFMIWTIMCRTCFCLLPFIIYKAEAEYYASIL